jgi:hypothetical protein
MRISVIIRYSLRPLRHIVYVLILRTECPREASSRVASSSLVAVCWIDGTASNLVSFLSIFNSAIKKAALRIGGVLSCRTQGHTFLKLRPNAIKSREQSLITSF